MDAVVVGEIISAVMARTCTIPVYAVVGPVTEDAPCRAFAQVLLAPDVEHMRAAGAQIVRELTGPGLLE